MSFKITLRLAVLPTFLFVCAAMAAAQTPIVSPQQKSDCLRQAVGEQKQPSESQAVCVEADPAVSTSSLSVRNADSGNVITTRMLDPAFTSVRAGGGVTPLQIASSTPYSGTLDKNYFGIYVDIDRTGDNNYFQTSGIRTWTNYSGSGGGFPGATGGEFITTNTGATNSDHFLQGSEGWATCTADCYEVQGATGFANSTTGVTVRNARAGMFQSGTSGNVFDQVGVLSVANPAGIDTTVTRSTAFRGTLMRTGTATVTNGYGLSLSGWSGGGFTNTAGIYADTSIDRGTTSRFFIQSYSTSPSLLSGDLTVGGSGKFFISTSETPAGAADACTTGQIAWDAGFIYICVAPNTWKRSAIATW